MDTVSDHERTRIDIEAAEMCRPSLLRFHSPRKDLTSPVKRLSRKEKLRPRCGCPVYGVRASPGRRARMEDAVSIVENLLEISRPGTFWKSDRANTDLLFEGNSNGTSAPVRRISKESQESEICHFFGVYDGHNGPYAAHHCRGRLHENLRAAYTDLRISDESDTESVSVTADNERVSEGESHSSRSSCSNSSFGDRHFSEAFLKRSHSTTEEDVFLETFRRTDSQFSEYKCAERVGTTALTALVGSKHITVGSCGDSRAVLYRAGQAIQMSNDHRLSVKGEKERIESSGGKVTDWNGLRVMGVLAMSRAIGDLCFRPYGVICDPEVTTLARSIEDEYLLLATDGLWDVLTNEEAYRIIRHTIASNRAQRVSLEECIQSSANRLTRIALDRGSRDNITVILIDLQSDISIET